MTRTKPAKRDALRHAILKEAMAKIGRPYRSPEEFIGLKFGTLTVKKFLGYSSTFKSNRRFLCQCDCGKECITWDTRFYDENPACHDCLAEKSHRFGQTRHKAYNSWRKYRRQFPQWQDFRAFARDVGDPPNPGMCLGAKDQSRPFSPDNWTWIPWREAGARKLRHKITVLGVTKSKSDWALICGVSKERMRQRLEKLDPESAVMVYDGAVKYFREHGMAERVKHWPGEELVKCLDGEIWRLDKGRDFQGDPASVRAQLLYLARQKGLKAITRSIGDAVFVQCVREKPVSKGKKRGRKSA